MTAAEQLRRVLHLIPALADDREHQVDEIAGILGVNRRTLLADLQALADRTDVPAGFLEGFAVWLDGEAVGARASHFLRPMRLTRSEVLALDLGLGMLRAERPAEEHRVIESARTRLRDVMARLPEEVVEDGDHRAATGSAVSPELLATMRHAARRQHKLRIGYQKADGSAPGERTVCPYALVFASGMWYLVAYCEECSGLRIFRADRVRHAAALEQRFTVPDEFSVAEVLRDGRAFRAEQTGRLVVRYSPRVARWIAEREARAPAEDGSLTVDYPLADMDWAVRHVLQYGPDAEIIEPMEARTAMRDRLIEMMSSRETGPP